MERCKPFIAARHPTKCDVINDVKLFPTVYRRIYCRKFLTLSNQTSRYKLMCIRMHNDCSHIIDVHLLFYAHFTNIFFILRGLELRHFSFKMLIWCVMCSSKSFHSLIFKICIIIVHTLNNPTCAPLYLWTLDKYFLIFRVVEFRHFPSKILRGVWFVKSVTQAVFIPLYPFFHPKFLG